ncbi:MAG TPA: ABC transporter permease, partial [Acidimicrobiales bacterium]|nr:ABC transporter permease [Acidimicrobiales bacterium]
MIADSTTTTVPEEAPARPRISRTLVLTIGALALLSLVRVLADADDLTSVGTFGAALRGMVPVLLAGLGGLFAERCGVVNIGLEGMMILGTWFGAWGAVEHGVWIGVLLG